MVVPVQTHGFKVCPEKETLTRSRSTGGRLERLVPNAMKKCDALKQRVDASARVNTEFRLPKKFHRVVSANHIEHLSQPETSLQTRARLTLKVLSNPVSKCQSTRTWYNRLGFNFGKQDSVKHIEASLGGFRFAFYENDKFEPFLERLASGPLTSRIDHWAFETDMPAQQVISLLEAENVPHWWAKVPETKTIQLFLRDPDGHAIELVFRPKQAAQPIVQDKSAQYAWGRSGWLGRLRLDHVSRLTKHLKEDAEYFLLDLGLHVISRPPFRVKGVWFELEKFDQARPPVQIHLVNADESEDCADKKIGVGADVYGFAINDGANKKERNVRCPWQQSVRFRFNSNGSYQMGA